MNKIDAYISKQKEVHIHLLQALRSIILNSSPLIEEKFSYQCPFYYYRKKPFVYMGVNKSYNNSVVIGFCNGVQLSNEQQLLVGEGKVVRHIVLNPAKSIPTQKINEILQESILVLEQNLRQ